MFHVWNAAILTVFFSSVGVPATPEWPHAIQERYEKEQNQLQGAGEIRLQACAPAANGTRRMDLLFSCRRGEHWVCRNRWDRLVLKDGKILSVRTPGTSADFWSAALTAEKIFYIETTGGGEHLQYFLPDGRSLPASEVSLSLDTRTTMRLPGRYAYPVPGNRALRDISPETLRTFRTLSAAQEEGWLRNRLTQLPPSPEAVEILKRLQAIGTFAVSMNAENRESWRQLLLQTNWGTAPRRLLLSLLFQENFLPGEDFVGELLMDPVLGSAVAEEFECRNRTEFRTLLRRWSIAPDRRTFALRYSEVLTDDQRYREQMLAAFRNPTPEQRFHLIPIYARQSAAAGSPELKKILLETAFPGHYRLLCQTAKWILRTHPAAYTREMKIFLLRERHQPELQRSLLYPLLLAALCRARDPEGISLAVTYLKSLKDPLQIENARRIWGKDMTGTVGIARILRELERHRQETK